MEFKRKPSRTHDTVEIFLGPHDDLVLALVARASARFISDLPRMLAHLDSLFRSEMASTVARDHNKVNESNVNCWC